MMKLIFTLLFVLVLVLACQQEQPVITSGDDADESSLVHNVKPTINQPGMEKTNTIEITSSGFNPGSLTINKGDSVIFINKDSSKHWPASAIHPTHKLYPGSDISKCNTSEEINIFDACSGLGNGESYSFTFNEQGSWKYHDHLKPSLTGTIVVV